MRNRTVYPAVFLTPEWHERLQRVAETCGTPPREFMREAIEAEIVRREILMGKQETKDTKQSLPIVLHHTSPTLH